MSQTQTTEEHAELSVENVGGIDSTEIAFSPGVTSLTGRNATNRTSLLQALMATLESDHVSLKGDADHGEVALTLDGETYTRTLERRNGTVVFDGDPYLEDRIADKRDELDAKEAEIEDADQTVDDTREQQNAFEDALDDLQEVRSDLEDVRYRIDTERESIQALEDERDELEALDADWIAALIEYFEEYAERVIEFFTHLSSRPRIGV